MTKILPFLTLLLAGCAGSPVEIVKVPVFPTPVLPQEPTFPSYEVPPVVVITAEEASYYKEACEALEADPSTDWYPGLSRAAACEWSVIGFTAQDWLTYEVILLSQVEYIKRLKAYAEFLRKLIESYGDQ